MATFWSLSIKVNKMKVKDLVENNKTHEDFPCCTIIYKHSEEGLVEVYDRIDTDETIKPFLSKQVEGFKIGTCYPSYFTLSIILKD